MGEVATDENAIRCPTEIVDNEALDFQKVWEDKGKPRSRQAEMLDKPRQKATRGEGGGSGPSKTSTARGRASPITDKEWTADVVATFGGCHLEE